jgi:hypothetical protein
MVTVVPTTPAIGESLLSTGAATVKGLKLLRIPPTVTTTLPVVAPLGTGTVMLVGVQFEAVAVVPPNETVFVPWLEPKFVPVMVTEVPTGAAVGDKLVIVGPDMTVNGRPLLATPPSVMTTFPVVAPLGNVTTTLAEDQVVTADGVPLKVTALEPCVAPRFVPVIRTVFPGSPDTGDKLVILGVGSTVNAARLLFKPLT